MYQMSVALYFILPHVFIFQLFLSSFGLGLGLSMYLGIDPYLD